MWALIVVSGNAALAAAFAVWSARVCLHPTTRPAARAVAYKVFRAALAAGALTGNRLSPQAARVRVPVAIGRRWVRIRRWDVEHRLLGRDRGCCPAPPGRRLSAGAAELAALPASLDGAAGQGRSILPRVGHRRRPSAHWRPQTCRAVRCRISSGTCM